MEMPINDDDSNIFIISHHGQSAQGFQKLSFANFARAAAWKCRFKAHGLGFRTETWMSKRVHIHYCLLSYGIRLHKTMIRMVFWGLTLWVCVGLCVLKA